jgi:exonuclease SbcD
MQSQAGAADDKQHALQLAIQAHYCAVFDAASARRTALERELGRVFAA